MVKKLKVSLRQKRMIRSQTQKTIKELEKSLEIMGTDADMTQKDLQDWMQRLTQIISMVASLSKRSHELSMSIIRNLSA